MNALVEIISVSPFFVETILTEINFLKFMDGVFLWKTPKLFAAGE